MAPRYERVKDPRIGFVSFRISTTEDNTG